MTDRPGAAVAPPLPHQPSPPAEALRARPPTRLAITPALTPPRAAPPAALLLDLDGTLVETAPLWAAVVAQVAAAHRATWDGPADAPRVVGAPVPALAALLVERGADASAGDLARELVAGVTMLLMREIPWRPGALELLTSASRRRVTTALVSTAVAEHGDLVAAQAPIGTLRTRITAEQVRRPKPDPEAYLLALDRLGVPAQDVVALEDSVPGLRSALAAGLTTLAVQPATELPDDVRRHRLLHRVADLGAARRALQL